MKPCIDAILDDCTVPPEVYMADRLPSGSYDRSELISRMCIDLVGRTISAMSSGSIAASKVLKKELEDLAADLDRVNVSPSGDFADGYEAASDYAAARIRHAIKGGR